MFSCILHIIYRHIFPHNIASVYFLGCALPEGRFQGRAWLRPLLRPSAWTEQVPANVGHRASRSVSLLSPWVKWVKATNSFLAFEGSSEEKCMARQSREQQDWEGVVGPILGVLASPNTNSRLSLTLRPRPGSPSGLCLEINKLAPFSAWDFSFVRRHSQATTPAELFLSCSWRTPGRRGRALWWAVHL